MDICIPKTSVFAVKSVLCYKVANTVRLQSFSIVFIAVMKLEIRVPDGGNVH